MESDIPGKKPIELEADTIAGLETVQEILEVLHALGEQIDDPFAWPSDEKTGDHLRLLIEKAGEYEIYFDLFPIEVN